MALITANTGAGNWNATGTWAGGVIPGAGDEAIIPSGATVTVPTGVTVTIGDTGTPTVRCVRLAGTLVVAGTLQLNADAEFTNNAAVLRVDAGAVVESSNGATAVTWWNNGGELRLRGTGVASARAVVRKGAGAGLSFRRDEGKGPNWTRLDAEWGLFSQLGSASIASVETYSLLGDDPGLSRLRDVVVDGCGAWTGGGFNWPVSGVSIWDWQRFRFKNSTATWGADLPVGAGAGYAALFTDGAFDVPYRSGITDVAYRRVAFTRQPAWGGGRWSVCEDVVFYDEDPASGNVWNVYGDVTRGIRCRNNPAAVNWQGLAMPRAESAVFDGVLYDGTMTDEQGDAIAAVEGATITVRNVLATRGPGASGSYGALVATTGSGPLLTATVEHCTSFTSLSLEAALFKGGETTAGAANRVTGPRHCLAVGRAAGTGTLVARLNAGAAANIRDHSTPASMVNNAVQNAVPGGGGVGPGNRTAAGGDGVMFSALPPAPLDVDPQFVDDTRNLATWYRSLVGGTPGTRAADTTLAVAAIASQWDDVPVAGATITAAQAWIRAGHAPQNVALKTDVSAANGGWIGAVEGIAPPPVLSGQVLFHLEQAARFAGLIP